MIMYYSALQNTWYDPDFRAAYESSGSWPADAVECPREVFDAVVTYRPIDKVMVADANGKPVLIDPPLPSPDVLATIERQWRDGRLLATDGVVSRHRDELEEGQETTLNPAQYAELQAYRRDLRNWPEAGEFPLIKHRPPAPLWLTGQLQ